MRPARKGTWLVALALGLVPAALGAGSGCSSEGAAAPPARACGLRVWHKPASREAHVEIVGDWNDWKRPGLVPDLTPDGWRVTELELPPGEHTYAILEDGAWLADRQIPTTAFYDGKEVALQFVPDCSVPELKVAGVEARADGHAVVSLAFAPARDGSALDPASVTATPRDASDPPLVVAGTSPLRLEATGLRRGKYIYAIKARDLAGRQAPDVRATVWIEDAAWDPRDAIVYQVVLDRFRGGAGPLAPPEKPSARAGGSLAGVRAALEEGYFASLGVNALWLSPLYKNPEGEFAGNDGRTYSSYHGYWPIASRELDSRFASDAELDAFMRAAHERGVRVLFDVVPNHVHEQHPWVNQFPERFNEGCVCGQGACDWGRNIRTCWFAPYLPDLDWTKPDVARAATVEVMWWFDRWGADGLRIDAVPMMPRAAIRRIVHDVRARWEHPGHVPYVLGENFTGPGAYQNLRYDLGPFGLDGSFNFPLMWTLRESIAAGRAPMAEIEASVRAGEEAWDGSGAVMGTMIGNHDVSRFASVSAGSDDGDAWEPAPQSLDPIVYGKQRLALATVLTLPGAPVLYYGDEVGLAGKGDPDCRRVMPADRDLLGAQLETRELARRIGRARACSAALRRGSLTTLLADEERFVFARELEGERVIVSLTRRPSTPVPVTVSPSSAAEWVDVVTGERRAAGAGALTIEPDAYGAHVWVAAGSRCAP